jgi:hypothetical protein
MEVFSIPSVAFQFHFYNACGLGFFGSKVQLKSMAEEMQAISKGLEKIEQELTASENDGPISDTFREV